MRRSVRGAAIVLAATLMAGACGGKKVEPPAPAPPTPPPAETKPTNPPPPPPPPAPSTPSTPSEDEIFAKKTVADLNAEKLLEDVFFGYDQMDLSEQARASLQKNMTFLKRWPTTKILVEGHADSRGTNEYNLALGERRAGAVRDYLVSLGLAADRVATVSKGEEQPFCREESESCWHDNRRGHLIFTAK